VYNSLIKRFGKDFVGQYGWATNVVTKGDANICKLEEKAGLGNLRPYYRMASHNVHPNIKGAKFRLGLGSRKMLLAGPSNYGFSDPACGAALSLNQITSALLDARPNMIHLIILEVLTGLVEKVWEEFPRIQRELDERERQLQGIT
jgi:hypothetical protein